MTDVPYREPAALGRLLIRSTLLGSLVPVTQGEFWAVKGIQVLVAVLVCLVLYGFEKAILWPVRKRIKVKPIYSAAYRGALLYAVLIFAKSADVAEALGACIGGALIAMLLFAIENGLIKLLEKGKSTAPSQDET